MANLGDWVSPDYNVFALAIVAYVERSIVKIFEADSVKGNDVAICPCFVPIRVAIVVAKAGSLFRAVARSFSLSSVAGAEFTKLAIAVDRLATDG